MANEDFVTLQYDDGVEMEFEIVGIFDCEGKDYIALAEMNAAGDDYTGEVFLYGYKEYGEDYDLIDITDEEEFKKAVAELDRLMMEAE